VIDDELTDPAATDDELTGRAATDREVAGRAAADYELSDDPARIDVPSVCAFLRAPDVYWARWRDDAVIRGQIESAWRVVGAYTASGEQVGFARAVSDGYALAYLADVYVLPEHRGFGLGGRIVRRMIEEGPGARFRWMLHTADAHGLYQQFGFAAPDPTYLERRASLG
jgi:GNAT superfamily N-acetyltransferase